jgi:hypothetical protein
MSITTTALRCIFISKYHIPQHNLPADMSALLSFLPPGDNSWGPRMGAGRPAQQCSSSSSRLPPPYTAALPINTCT